MRWASAPRGSSAIPAAPPRRPSWQRPPPPRPPSASRKVAVLRLYAEHGTFRRQDGQFELKCPGKIEAELYRNSLSPSTWDLLPDIRCPTLVLRGQHTEQFLALVAQGVAQRIPAARLVTIAGAGHFVPMERPDSLLGERL